MRVRQWELSPRATALLGLGGILTLIASAVGYGSLYIYVHPSPGSLALNDWSVVVLAALIELGLTALLLLVHEGLHGFVMWAVGRKPKPADWKQRPYPHLFGMPGPPLGKGRFALVMAFPAAVIAVMVAVAVVRAPYGGVWVVPGSIALATCLADLVYAWAALATPPDTTVRITSSGLEFLEPVHEVSEAALPVER